MDNSKPSQMPFVSVVIPCRNEEGFIGRCLDSLVHSDYPADRMEVLVVDGRSDDQTRAEVASYTERHRFVRVLDNPSRVTPIGVNIGIREAAGEFVFWFGAHSHCTPDYIRRSVDGIAKHDADCVGGVMVTEPRDNTIMAKAIVAAISHPFGVGNSHFRTMPTKPMWVDTVFGACYRRPTFQRIGLLNERLVRGQDLEFNLRLRRSGGRTLLLPDMAVTYHARSTFGSFWLHNWINGKWAILPFIHSPISPISGRHLVPLLFVCSVLLASGAALVSQWGRWALLLVLGPYVISLLAASAHIAIRSRDPRMFFVMPVVFANLHFAYGLGSVVGAVQVLARLFRGVRRPAPADAWPQY